MWSNQKLQVASPYKNQDTLRRAHILNDFFLSTEISMLANVNLAW